MALTCLEDPLVVRPTSDHRSATRAIGPAAVSCFSVAAWRGEPPNLDGRALVHQGAEAVQVTENVERAGAESPRSGL